MPVDCPRRELTGKHQGRPADMLVTIIDVCYQSVVRPAVCPASDGGVTCRNSLVPIFLTIASTSQSALPESTMPISLFILDHRRALQSQIEVCPLVSPIRNNNLVH